MNTQQKDTMNYPMFWVFLLVFSVAMCWLVIQPGSLSFIAIRIIISFISIILVFFSVTWYEKKGWKKAALVLLVILGMGSIANFAFGWGIQNYPAITLISMPIIAVLIILYIKCVEPKVLAKGK
jgi:hypothetical protein